jgi:ribosome-associated protein
MTRRDDRDESRRQAGRHARRDAGDRSARVARTLMNLRDAALRKLVVDDELRASIDEARAVVSPIARRRAERALAGELRGVDLDALEAALRSLEDGGVAASRVFHQAEQWRARLIDEGSDAAAGFPGGDTEELRRLIQQARRERDTGKPRGAARALFRHVFALLERQAASAGSGALEQPGEG